jgi:hypothetical protein
MSHHGQRGITHFYTPVHHWLPIARDGLASQGPWSVDWSADTPAL